MRTPKGTPPQFLIRYAKIHRVGIVANLWGWAPSKIRRYLKASWASLPQQWWINRDTEQAVTCYKWGVFCISFHGNHAPWDRRKSKGNSHTHA